MFALGTVKSPVFSLAHDRYHLNKITAEGRSWCCFCQESHLVFNEKHYFFWVSSGTLILLLCGLACVINFIPHAMHGVEDDFSIFHSLLIILFHSPPKVFSKFYSILAKIGRVQECIGNFFPAGTHVQDVICPGFFDVIVFLSSFN